MRALVVAGAALLVPSLAGAKPVVEKVDGVTIDFSAGTVEAAGAGAPDLRAPSVKVARVGAERQARLDAAKRIRAALARLPKDKLGCDDATKLPPFDAVALAAAPKEIDWGSDGSVKLVLRISVAALLLVTGSVDGGVAPSSSIPSGGGAGRGGHPLFRADGGDCARAVPGGPW